MNPNFPVNTLLLMRAFIAAKKRGELEQFIEIAFKAMWEDGKKMDDPETFVEVFTDGGLDGQTLLEATQDSKSEVDGSNCSVAQTAVPSEITVPWLLSYAAWMAWKYSWLPRMRVATVAFG